MKRRQPGFALIAALFLLVLLATIGIFAIRLDTSQQQNVDLDLAVARAEAAMDSGVQIAASRLLGGGNCTDLGGITYLPQDFRVTFACQLQPSPSVVNGLPVNVFLVTAIAARGNYGSPEFVSRQRVVRITP